MRHSKTIPNGLMSLQRRRMQTIIAMTYFQLIWRWMIDGSFLPAFRLRNICSIDTQRNDDVCLDWFGNVHHTDNPRVSKLPIEARSFEKSVKKTLTHYEFICMPFEEHFACLTCDGSEIGIESDTTTNPALIRFGSQSFLRCYIHGMDTCAAGIQETESVFLLSRKQLSVVLICVTYVWNSWNEKREVAAFVPRLFLSWLW